MNKALYICGLISAIIFMSIATYYSAEVSSARLDYLFSDFADSTFSLNGYSITRDYSSLTTEAALWSMFFFLLFIAIDLLGLLKIKTRTTKVFSIIGLSTSFIFLLWNLLVLSSPSAMSFDEISPAWILYCFIMLAFSIVGLVQSIKYKNRITRTDYIGINQDSKDLLDS